MQSKVTRVPRYRVSRGQPWQGLPPLHPAPSDAGGARAVGKGVRIVEKRTTWLRARVSPDELEAVQAAAAAAGVGLSDYVRQRVLTGSTQQRAARRRPGAAAPALVQRIASAQRALVEIARFCRDRNAADAVQIIAALAAVERALLLSYRPSAGASDARATV